MANSTRQALLASIVSTIADYRQGAIPPPDANHVDHWVQQFDPAVQDLILAELAHVLPRTYFPKASVEGFLGSVITCAQLVGANPRAFWNGANFLGIQTKGNSQRELLSMFDLALQKTQGISTTQCGSHGGAYIYLDDAVFSGFTVLNDLTSWIRTTAPPRATVHIVALAIHSRGRDYATKRIAKECRAANKTIEVSWWGSMHVEDLDLENLDVLCPSTVPSDATTQAYVQGLRRAPFVRLGAAPGKNGFYSSDASRNTLEQTFLQAGLHIRSVCPLLNNYQRPLGNMVLETFGFGALIVTFRNCPNNCPLALWAGAPWYPLFPRRTN